MWGVQHVHGTVCILYLSGTFYESILHPASQVLNIPLDYHSSLLPWLSFHTTGHLTFMVHWVFGLLVLIFPTLIVFAAGCPLVLTVSSSNSMGTSFVFMVWGLQKWTETGEGSGSIQSLCDWLRQTSSVTFFSFWRLHISKTIPGQHQINFAHAAWITMHLPQCDFLTD